MREWTVKVVAQKAFMGNPDDPLIWHFLAFASSAAQAVYQVRRNPDIPAEAEISAKPGRIA